MLISLDSRYTVLTMLYCLSYCQNVVCLIINTGLNHGSGFLFVSVVV